MKKSTVLSALTGSFFVLLLVTFLSTSSAHAHPKIVCLGRTEDFTLGVGGILNLKRCFDRNGDQYELLFEGIGPGLQVGFRNTLSLACPLVFKDKMTQDPFYGLKITASGAVGADLALLSNKRAGVCLMTGVKLGIGAAVTVDKLTIKKLNALDDE